MQVVLQLYYVYQRYKSGKIQLFIIRSTIVVQNGSFKGTKIQAFLHSFVGKKNQMLFEQNIASNVTRNVTYKKSKNIMT